MIFILIKVKIILFGWIIYHFVFSRGIKNITISISIYPVIYKELMKVVNYAKHNVNLKDNLT